MLIFLIICIHSVTTTRTLTWLVLRATLNQGQWLQDIRMGKHQRVLLLGPTGVEKGVAVQRLAKYVQDKFGHAIRYIDFEKEFLHPVIAKHGFKNFFTFLAQDSNRQAIIWKAAWENCAKVLDGQIIILGLHATYINTIVGLRCAVDLGALCNTFRPTLVVTLSDDVQNMWFRTEERAQGKDARGRPTFEQLLTARRAEQLLGDMIVTHSEAAVRHIMVATTNSVAALANVIIFDGGVTYLSFPISAPRRMQARGDKTFIELINNLHRLASDEMEKDRTRAFITPLAIDELPMVKKWEKTVKASEKENKPSPTAISYSDVVDRWPQADLWGSDELAIIPAIRKEFPIPAEQIKSVAGIVETDVGWRDRRLVLQAHSLAICCPKDPDQDRITRGVKTELEAATAIGIPSFYWQNPVWDPAGFVSTQFEPAGSMGLGATEALVQRAESLEALIRAKP